MRTPGTIPSIDLLTDILPLIEEVMVSSYVLHGIYISKRTTNVMASGKNFSQICCHPSD